MAVETEMFQKKIRPVDVVSVTPAARASTSRCVFLQGPVILNRDDGPSDNPISYFQRIEGLRANVANQRRKDWSCVCVLREDSNTYPQLPRQRRLMLNCSTKGALQFIPSTGGDPF